ncbi:glycosyltransferase family 2 protein [Zhongshania arctica]|uniref:Glycosyltransferase family 2 protein n=1 Tax=Zhongshania arctica TaxID=3238302 RepID=A0ABV3TSF4_9GAMM
MKNCENENPSKVSVCVVTYNQEKYIAGCLESLVGQVVNFKYEIIVGDDFSTDGTREILISLQRKYPKLIRLNFQACNVGAIANMVSTYRLATGKYISHIDGDDFALENKLQKQFNALEEDSNCVICSHDMLIVDSEGKEANTSFRRHKKKINSLVDLYSKLPFFAHSSKMFLNDLDDSYWENFTPETIDIEIHVKQSMKGNIYHLDDVLGGYRSMVGISLKNNCVNPALPNATDRVFAESLLNPDLNHRRIKRSYAAAVFSYAYQSAIYGDKKGVVDYIDKSIRISYVSPFQILFKCLSSQPWLLVCLARLRAKMQGYKI